MEWKIGTLYKLNGSPVSTVAVVSVTADGTALYYPVGEEAPVVELDDGVKISTARLFSSAHAESAESVRTLSPNESDALMRAMIRANAEEYFRTVKNKTPRRNIPPSGKVLDERELINMFDASMDMWLTTGRFNDRFEKELARFLGVKYALTVNSGSSANLLAVSALTSYKLEKRQIHPGDEVITLAAGFPTTINPIIQNGLVPVFVDIKLGTYTPNMEQLEKAITPRTRAIFIAHTLGNPYDLNAIKALAEKHDLWLIEDNCDALGSKFGGKYTGTFGDIGTLSFYPAHHITMGEGGAVLTNDVELYKILMSFRDWGRDCWCPPGRDNTCGRRFEWKLGTLPAGYDHKYTYSHIGYNLKIGDWQAAVGLAQLEKLPGFIRTRRENFRKLTDGLAAYADMLLLPEALPDSEPSWFGYLITVKETAPFDKLQLVRFLEENGVGTRQLFAGNMLRQPAFLHADFALRIADSKMIRSGELTDAHYAMLPMTDAVMNRTFWIGVWPGIGEDEIEKILSVFAEFMKG